MVVCGVGTIDALRRGPGRLSRPPPSEDGLAAPGLPHAGAAATRDADASAVAARLMRSELATLKNVKCARPHPYAARMRGQADQASGSVCAWEGAAALVRAIATLVERTKPRKQHNYIASSKAADEERLVDDEPSGPVAAEPVLADAHEPKPLVRHPVTAPEVRETSGGRGPSAPHG